MEKITHKEKLKNRIELKNQVTEVVGVIVSEDFYEIIKRQKQSELRTPETLGEFNRIMGVQLTVNEYLPYNYFIIGKNGTITKG